MKKLLIIKTGTTYPSIREREGDFDDMVIAGAGLARQDVTVCPVYDSQPLPGLSGFYGVIITGSHAMVTDREKWSEQLAQWVRDAAFGRIPVLGICYAHQLLAQALGGKVGYHPGGLEMGSALIELTAEGMADPLLEVLPAKFTGHVAHAQTVTALPAGARGLAHNSFEPHHAIAFGHGTWGLQFHPEFTAGTVHMYIDEDKAWLEKKGYNTGAMHSSVVESPYGEAILKRFIELSKRT
jgi:GMP synthase (glutamine-hydrolysing)